MACANGVGSIVDLQGTHDAHGGDESELERADQAQHVVPMRCDAIEVDALPGQRIEITVVGVRIDAPKAAAADVGQAGTEAIAQQSEQPENDIAVGAGVGHDLGGLQLGLLLQHDRQQDQAVAQGAGHRDRVEAGALIGEQVVPGDAATAVEILRVRSGVEASHGDHEAHAVGGCHIAAAPGSRQRDAILCGDQHRIGRDERVVAQVDLVDPHEPIAAQRWRLGANEWFGTGIACLGEQHRA